MLMNCYSNGILFNVKGITLPEVHYITFTVTEICYSNGVVLH